MVAMRKLGTIAKGNTRDRRPTLEELDRLMTHFEKVRAHRPRSAPMTKIIAFAIFSTRRQEEITRITWDDYDKAAGRVWVRDMKNPGRQERQSRPLRIAAGGGRNHRIHAARRAGNISVLDRRHQRGVHPSVPAARNQRSAFSRLAARRHFEIVRNGQDDPAGCRRVRTPELEQPAALYAFASDRRQIRRLAMATRHHPD